MARNRRHRTFFIGGVALLLGGSLLGAVASADPPESGLNGWPRQLGAAGQDVAGDVAVSSAGDVYVAGFVDGAFPGQTPQGTTDAFIARYDKYGKLKWLRQFGTTDSDQIHGIVLSGSSIYVAGQTRGTFSGQSNAGATDGFVARYDSNGNQKWVRQFGTPHNDYVDDLAYSSSDVFVTGQTYGAFPGQVNADLGVTGDVFVTRYSTSGNHELTYQFGTSANDNGLGIAVSGSSTYIVGETLGSLPGFTNLGSGDSFLARYDKSGTLKALDQIGTSGNDTAWDVAVTGSQIYVVGSTDGTMPGATGSFTGLSDAFLIRYDTSAVPQWVTQLGGADFELGFAVAVRSSQVYITGFTNGALPGWTNLGDFDGFAAKISTNGIIAWTRQFGTDDSDTANAIGIRSSDSYGGAVVIAGYTYGTMWSQFNYGESDAFVATFPK